jgi:hypothetical protein
MTVRREMTDAQAAAAVDAGEFCDDIRAASQNVAVILTQSWCPQWVTMEKWLRGLERDGKPDGYDLTVYHYVYDKAGTPKDFLRFKEKVLGSHQIPHVRYYRAGRLVSKSNYVGSRDFLAVFGSPKAEA